MTSNSRSLLTLAALSAALISLTGCQSGGGGGFNNGNGHTPPESSLSSEAKAALNQLTANNPAAAAMASSAKGILVFPQIIKGGFIIGGFHGEGVMFERGWTSGYYDSTGGSYGLQAGLQTYAYALFFMSDADLQYLKNSSGWEVGTGPSLTVVDKGIAGSLTTTTVQSGVYCFFFDQKGLMAGLSLQGSKITQIDR